MIIDSWISHRIVVGLAAALAIAVPARAQCSGPDEREDAWFHASTSAPTELFYESNDVAVVTVVARSKQGVAGQILGSRPFAELTPAQAGELTEQGLQPADARRYFLLRGLSLDRRGLFRVTELGGTVRVAFIHLGPPIGRARRTAVIAALKGTPKVVYVECGGAM